ncbi:MAG: peptide-methionine (S)-S-oxide reductase MsrA [Acidobacteriota bacterium]
MKNTLRAVFAACFAVASLGAASSFPDPVKDIKATAPASQQTAVLAGGCFWGVEAVFERLNGVSDVVSGFAGGSQSSAHYSAVGTGTTGHAEAVKITYDPAVISYGTLLKVFFAVAHDPTELNRQGPDEGTQYRSSIFYANEEQKGVAEAYIQQLTAGKIFKRGIATTVAPLKGFYAAEDYHQNYLDQHPTQPYIVINDLPKLKNLQAEFPNLVKPGKVK